MMSRKRERLLRWVGVGAVVAVACVVPEPWTLVVLPLLVPLLYAPAGTRISVLVYHSIHPDRSWMGAPDLVVTPERFAAQMDWLARHGFKTLHMDVLYALRARPRRRRRVAAVHFDDGYGDAISHAEAALARNGLKATVYVAPGLLADRPAHPVLPPRDDLPREAFLALSEMVAAHRRGVLEFQCHGWSHRPLDQVPPDQWDSEICDSRALLAGALAAPVRHLCFPRDAAPTALLPRLRALDYLTWTGGDHDNRVGTDPHRVGRIYVTQSGWDALDAIRFSAEIYLFLGHYWLWPVVVVGNALTRAAWRRAATAERRTP